MGRESKISWTNSSWNPTIGCSIKSEGCTRCYAMRMASRFGGPGQRFEGIAKVTAKGPKWTGVVRINENSINKPLHWKKASKVFVNSMSDLFHESLSFQDVDRVFDVMAKCPQHTFQVLTKRHERMREFSLKRLDEFQKGGRAWPLRHVWLGVSCENQKWANERIPHLVHTPAAVRFLSVEPMLGPVNLERWLEMWRCLNCGYVMEPITRELSPGELADGGDPMCSECHTTQDHELQYPYRPIDQVIVGCESGPGRRPMDEDWARSVRDQCKEAKVGYFLKQLIRRYKGRERKIETPKLDGKRWAQYPKPMSKSAWEKSTFTYWSKVNTTV